MKILVTTIAASLLICISARAQHISDSIFAEKIRNKYPECIDAKNNLLPPAKKLEELRLWSEEIKDITGISGFSGLHVLALSMNRITVLPILPANLTELDVSFNRELTVLPPLPFSLKKLNIQYTLVRNLPASLPPELEYLKISHTQVNILPKLPGSLRDLYIEETPITALPQLPDKLETLIYNDKYIHCIPCKNAQLTVIEAGINKVVTPKFCNTTDQLISKNTVVQNVTEIKVDDKKDGGIKNTVVQNVAEIKVGDKKDGGIVYWIDVSGKHGLIADVDDLGEYEWKEAIRACNALGNGWHLPDRTELQRLYENKNVVAKFSTGYGFSSGYYWSSSEVVYEGYGINFGNGSGTTLNGGVSYYVRAVRKF